MLHGCQGDVEAYHFGDILRPGAARVDHDAGFDGTAVGLHADDFFLVVHRRFGEDVDHGGVFVELHQILITYKTKRVMN